MDVREHVGAAFFGGVQNLFLTRLPQVAKLKKTNSDFQFVAEKRVFFLFVFYVFFVSLGKNTDFNILQQVEYFFFM